MHPIIYPFDGHRRAMKTSRWKQGPYLFYDDHVRKSIEFQLCVHENLFRHFKDWGFKLMAVFWLSCNGYYPKQRKKPRAKGGKTMLKKRYSKTLRRLHQCQVASG